MQEFLSIWKNWLIFGGTFAGILVGVLIAHALLFRVVKRLAASRPPYAIFYSLKSLVRVLFILLAGLMLLPASPSSVGFREALERALDLGMIGCAARIVVVLIEGLEESLTLRYRLDGSENLLARRIRTRIQVFHHIAVSLIVLLSLAVGLMIFPNVRSLGASLLASAGLAGIVAGMAARSALSNLIAGLQIALTEPIRIDDVVIVENEWGWVEEIYATYVVVRIWDLRRLILPLSYFIEHPFQNWTRTSADLLGTVFIYTDYRVPVQALREELTRILKSTPLWKGQVNGLQVTDATDHSMQLRALMDASDSGKAWDLRCYVREKLIEFMQTHYPESLPRTRLELQRPLK